MKSVLLGGFLMLAGCVSFAQELKYVNKNNDWDADSLGNHRVVLTLNNATGKIAKATIEWRRNDLNPASKALYVIDSTTNRRIQNVFTLAISRESCALFFEPSTGDKKYFVYYMPYKVDRSSNYPDAVYLNSHQTARGDWLLSLPGAKNVELAKVESIESINAINSFYPMEIIATAAETDTLVKHNSGKSYLIFPEDRLHSIRMKHDLPQRWILNGVTNTFNGEAQKGENYAYQLGIYPVLNDLKDVRVTFSDMKDAAGNIIPSTIMSCLNTAGVTFRGNNFTKEVNVAKGDIQAFWCLINIPASATAGTYEGYATVSARGVETNVIKIVVKVNEQLAVNGGVNEPWKQTRLTWLNSNLARANDVIKPYTPLVVSGKSISLLGRRLTLDEYGFPKSIQTFFTSEMTAISEKAREVLSSPVIFVAANGSNDEDFKSKGMRFTDINPGSVRWASVSTSANLQMDLIGSLEFDGYVAYTVKITALKDVNFTDIRMDIPFNKDVAKYMMGLNLKGSKRPANYDWKWDVEHKNQDGAWLGDVNAGLQFSLRDENYIRPLNTNFYLQKPLVLPSSWGNNNKGGINIIEAGNTALVVNYSGPRSMMKGQVLYYNFSMLITPFHPLNTDFQWENRFYHKYANIDTIKATGATIVNIHHATPINPYINYPFIATSAMKAYINEAHQKGLKVKIYNTVRELSNSAYETFAMRSLGHEIYSAGKGGGYSWLQEHLIDDYIPAWYVPGIKDAAIVNSGMSRWHNYYVEGMNWLVQNVGVDGIYLDDVAFDRTTMKRVKRVLTQDGRPGIIDLHSANQYNKNDGFNNSANLYMEHFPYLNRLWFGEYFDYEKNTPDFFLTEVSGIPFGLMGEMLQDGGNQWRGMVYGMTNRMPWSDNADPRPLWKVWDDFGMKGSKMIGYWVDYNPIKTNNPDVLATIYVKDKTALVSIASWAKDFTNIKLLIDWKALGIDPSKAMINAPRIKNFQPEASFAPAQDIIVQPGKGWLLIIKER